MKRILYLCCLLGFTACNNHKPETVQTYPTTPNGLQGIQQSTVKSSAMQSGTSVALNPAHGQPGHRCDIAVGAPLNSKPSQATTAPQITTEITPPPTANTPAAPTKTPMFNEKGQRLNPEHGKPGHKCEIPVGAPLT